MFSDGSCGSAEDLYSSMCFTRALNNTQGLSLGFVNWFLLHRPIQSLVIHLQIDISPEHTHNPIGLCSKT